MMDDRNQFSLDQLLPIVGIMHTILTLGHAVRTGVSCKLTWLDAAIKQD
jgi:hypothetical protein